MFSPSWQAPSFLSQKSLFKIIRDFAERSEWHERSGSCRTAREAVSECEQRASFNGAIRPNENSNIKCLDATPFYSPRIVLGILGGDLRVKFAGFGKLPNLEVPIGRIDF